MTHFRPFRNTDAPALAELWNAGLPEVGVVYPLTAHEIDALVYARVPFDRQGLIIAERDDELIGFVHAGFGPIAPEGPSHRLDFRLGSIAMLVMAPEVDDPVVEQRLIREAEGYLKGRGAQVIYAGGQYPVNPFYWGIYGGSEFSGILGAHAAFQRASQQAGYQPISKVAILERNLSRSVRDDPRSAVWKAQSRVEFQEDVLPAGWWEALAIGLFRPTRARVLDRHDGAVLASATTWEIAGATDTGDGYSRTAVINVQVHPAHRRRGLGRFLIDEIAREARRQYADILALQTPETNLAAMGLYSATGFDRVETATLYRKPG